MFKLRRYQAEAVNAGVEWLNGTKKSGGLIVAPTASGKSLIIAGIAQQLEGRTIVLQPSKEVLEQNLEKLEAFGVDDIGVFSASCKSKIIGKITLATIGTIISKKEAFDDFQHLIIDECHAVDAKGGQYEEFINHFGGHCLGLTATPYRLHTFMRHDKSVGAAVIKFLHRTRPRIFTEIISITQIPDLFAAGYLCPVEYQAIPYNDSRLIPNSNGSEFDLDSIKNSNELNKTLHKAAAIIKGLAEAGKKSLSFCVFVEEAAALADELRQAGISAEIISAQTPSKERARILHEFQHGKIMAVTNVGTLTTGYDFPALAAVLMIRPTRSLGLYYQMAGRVLRISPGKDKALLFDLCGNVKRFGRIETFKIVEPKRGMHRLISEKRPLTGYDFVNDDDLELNPPKIDFKKGPQTMPFGKFKGENIEKIPDWYVKWGFKNLGSQSLKSMFWNEANRRGMKI